MQHVLPVISDFASVDFVCCYVRYVDGLALVVTRWSRSM